MVRIPVQERIEICLAIAHDIASNGAYYITEVQKRTNGGGGYLRAVYVCEDEAATADRIACAMLSDVGPLLQEALRSRTASLDSVASTPCWLTICEPNGCTLHHVAFGIHADQGAPVNVMEKVDVAEDDAVADGERAVPELSKPVEEAKVVATPTSPAAEAPFSAPPDDIFTRDTATEEADQGGNAPKPAAKDPNEVLDGFAKIIKARRLSRDLQEKRDSYLSDAHEHEEAIGSPAEDEVEIASASPEAHLSGADAQRQVEADEGVSEPPETSPTPAEPRQRVLTPPPTVAAASEPTRPSHGRVPLTTSLQKPAFPPGPCPHSSRAVAKALGLRHAASRPSSRGASPAGAVSAEERRGQYYYNNTAPAPQQPQPSQRLDSPSAYVASQPTGAAPRSAPQRKQQQASAPALTSSVARAAPPARAAPSADRHHAAAPGIAAAPPSGRARDVPGSASGNTRSRSQSSVFRVAAFPTEPTRPSVIEHPGRGSHQTPDSDAHRESFSSYREDLWRHADSVMTVASALDDFERSHP